MKTEDKIKQSESPEQKATDSCQKETCVCNMEWRGSRGDEESDCICYPENEDK